MKFRFDPFERRFRLRTLVPTGQEARAPLRPTNYSNSVSKRNISFPMLKPARRGACCFPKHSGLPVRLPSAGTEPTRLAVAPEPMDSVPRSETGRCPSPAYVVGGYRLRGGTRGGEISARMDQNEISSCPCAKERLRCMEGSALGNVICWMG